MAKRKKKRKHNPALGWLIAHKPYFVLEEGEATSTNRKAVIKAYLYKFGRVVGHNNQGYPVTRLKQTETDTLNTFLSNNNL